MAILLGDRTAFDSHPSAENLKNNDDCHRSCYNDCLYSKGQPKAVLCAPRLLEVSHSEPRYDYDMVSLDLGTITKLTYHVKS